MLKQLQKNQFGVDVIKIHDTCNNKKAICRISIGLSDGMQIHDVYYVLKDEDDLTQGVGKLIFPGTVKQGKFSPFIVVPEDTQAFICDTIDAEMVVNDKIVPEKKRSIWQDAAEGVLKGIAAANATPEQIKKNVEVATKVFRRKK